MTKHVIFGDASTDEAQKICVSSSVTKSKAEERERGGDSKGDFASLNGLNVAVTDLKPFSTVETGEEEK